MIKFDISFEDWMESFSCIFIEELIEQKQFSTTDIKMLMELLANAHGKTLFVWTPIEADTYTSFRTIRSRCIYCGKMVVRPIISAIQPRFHSGPGQFNPDIKSTTSKICHEIDKFHERSRNALADCLASIAANLGKPG